MWEDRKAGPASSIVGRQWGPMEQELWDTEATLWFASAPVARGPFRECFRNWSAMPPFPRTKAYIQIRHPVANKRVYRLKDLYELSDRSKL